MANRIISKDTYERLLAAYRLQPGVYNHAGRYADCSKGMAKTAWESGWLHRFDWAKPIRQVLMDEQLAARSRVFDEEAERRKAGETEREKARQEAAEVLMTEAGILKLARQDVLGLLAITARLAQPLQRVMTDLTDSINAGQLAGKPDLCVRVLNRFSQSTRQLTEAAKLLIEVERLRKGEPTQVLGLQMQDMTAEEALRELEEARALLTLVREPVAETDTQQGGNGSVGGNGAIH